ncbi:hypothetical protein EF294_15735 [Gordonia oryzae]|uniref:Uncharacterized protein n=1 Tax=Gordonia oryzae TaxID=2487349 RepID=A0A3N4GDD8_9ACTN|nr:hypothetical protein [Gordonia oryzae]RPA58606.1 hypothetical protein EF294_15735 [Gordonia oryzae]
MPKKRRTQLILAGIGVILLLALIGSCLPDAPTPKVAATGTTTTSRLFNAPTTTSSATSTVAADLPSVPLGTPQKISGHNEDGSSFAATVTATAVTRTSDYHLVVDATIDITSGVLIPGYTAWTLVTAGGQDTPLSTYGDGGFGERLSGSVRGRLDASLSTQAQPSQIRFASGAKAGGESPNRAAVWTVTEVATSVTTTPVTPGGDGSGGTTNYYNIPNPNLPNVHPCRHTRWC